MEACDGLDNDCDGQVDEGLGCSGTQCGFFNGTFQGSCSSPNVRVNGFCVPCADNDADGFTTCQGDCSDANAAIHPTDVEACDGLDNNCDGQIDEGFDLNTDPNNCGQCGNVCPPGWTCGNGTCVVILPLPAPVITGSQPQSSSSNYTISHYRSAQRCAAIFPVGGMKHSQDDPRRSLRSRSYGTTSSEK